ncbi:MAG: hypothetical protein E7609_07690 [Ruminococcaceae bacterium]|nr:hypothetical protein [Oscillospiraceae bacterium]
MKQRIKFVCRTLLVGVLIALLLAACIGYAFADETTPQSPEDVLTYDGLSARMLNYGGIRSVYLVDRDAVASLEASGYKVAYGAVMAIASYDGETLNTTRSLTVAGDHENGYNAANSYAATVVVYATDAPDYATGVYLDKSNSSFAFTTTFNDAVSEKYAMELVYTGFVAVTDAEGNQSIVYDYAEGSLFGAESSTYGGGTSALDVADWFVNNYSKDAVKAYNYNKNGTLKSVLTTCGKEVRTLSAPVTVTPIEGEVTLTKSPVNQYVTAARAAYRTSEYADYTTSIVGNYTTYPADKKLENDVSLPVTLSWALNGNGAPSYTVTLATDASFKENVRTYTTTENTLDAYNLFTGTTYYYKVKATTADGQSFESATFTFKTANTVRWGNVGGVRNVRDVGGWNGVVKQGLVYRGAEMNANQTYSSDITEAGIYAMKNELGVRTDLDLRAPSANAQFGTSSPLGEGVKWINYTVSAFSIEASYYASTMKTFADYSNYPIYIHCAGGADRTGTVALMLLGLCGVDEADLSVEHELTSFSHLEPRYRYDHSSYKFATSLAMIKEYEGNTLQEKFESFYRKVYNFSEAEISNIQAILTQNGAVYDFAEGDNGSILYEDLVDGKFSMSFVMRNSTAVESVTVGGVALDFVFDPATATLTVDSAKLVGTTGIGTVVFDDGATLRFDIDVTRPLTTAEKIVAGDLTLLIQYPGTHYVNDGVVTTKKDAVRRVEFKNDMLEELRAAGYTKITFNVTVTTDAGDNINNFTYGWYCDGCSEKANAHWVENTKVTPVSGTPFAVCFDLTEDTCGHSDSARIYISGSYKDKQYGLITLSDFIFLKS